MPLGITLARRPAERLRRSRPLRNGPTETAHSRSALLPRAQPVRSRRLACSRNPYASRDLRSRRADPPPPHGCSLPCQDEAQDSERHRRRATVASASDGVELFSNVEAEADSPSERGKSLASSIAQRLRTNVSPNPSGEMIAAKAMGKQSTTRPIPFVATIP